VFVSQLKAGKLGCFARTRIPRQKNTIYDLTTRERGSYRNWSNTAGLFTAKRSLTAVRHTRTRRTIVLCHGRHGVELIIEDNQDTTVTPILWYDTLQKRRQLTQRVRQPAMT